MAFESNGDAQSIKIKHCDIRENLELYGAIPSTSIISLDHCHIHQDLIASGELSLFINQCEIDNNIEIKEKFNKLTLEETLIHKNMKLSEVSFSAVDISNSNISHAFLAGNTKFNSFTLYASNILGNSIFSNSEFSGAVKITRDTKGNNRVNLAEVIFHRQVNFSQAKFYGNFDLSHTIIKQSAKFEQAHFEKEANFSHLQVKDNAIFIEASFKYPPNFQEAIFERNIKLDKCK